MTHKTLIPIGPYHPLQEEAEFFQLFVEGETVVDIVEELAEVEVPDRALYLRTIINELERIHSHLLWFGLAGHFIGYNTVFMWAWRYREPCLDALEVCTGSRINYANHTVGGSRKDITPDMAKYICEKMDEIEGPLDMLITTSLEDPILALRLKGVGVLTEEDARRLGACGPTVRASNVPIDVRRDDPYAAYDRLDWDVISCPNGDVFDKVVVRLLETKEAIKIIRLALADLPEGPIQAKVKEVPPGEGVGHVEAPRGETFHFVKSNGGPGPERHKIRAPSFNNVPTFKASCIGQPIADVTITLASIDPCYSCTERMLVARDSKTGKELMGFSELVELSRDKTEQIRKQA